MTSKSRTKLSALDNSFDIKVNNQALDNSFTLCFELTKLPDPVGPSRRILLFSNLSSCLSESKISEPCAPELPLSVGLAAGWYAPMFCPPTPI